MNTKVVLAKKEKPDTIESIEKISKIRELLKTRKLYFDLGTNNLEIIGMVEDIIICLDIKTGKKYQLTGAVIAKDIYTYILPTITIKLTL